MLFGSLQISRTPTARGCIAQVCSSLEFESDELTWSTGLFIFGIFLVQLNGLGLGLLSKCRNICAPCLAIASSRLIVWVVQ